MTRMPPRLPRPARPQRSLRTPPDPRITSPPSGLSASACCTAAYSSSDRYCPSSDLKSLVSINVSTTGSEAYVSAVYSVNRPLRNLRAEGGQDVRAVRVNPMNEADARVSGDHGDGMWYFRTHGHLSDHAGCWTPASS